MPKTGFLNFDTGNSLIINYAKNYVKKSKKIGGLEVKRLNQ